jgi:hypothetical protein
MKKQEKESLENKPKRQKITIGAILEISIEGRYFVYAQILPKGEIAFFDFRNEKPLADYSVLNNAPILFILCVYRYVVAKGIWHKVGKLPIRKELDKLPNQFIYDKFTGEFSLYITETGEILSTTKENVRGLERCAVWGENHVTDRIRDYYNHIPCVWMEQDYELFPELRP